DLAVPEAAGDVVARVGHVPGTDDRVGPVLDAVVRVHLAAEEADVAVLVLHRQVVDVGRRLEAEDVLKPRGRRARAERGVVRSEVPGHAGEARVGEPDGGRAPVRRGRTR